ncbi:NAD(P)-dependent oxidoreductase [Microbacterium yannicii]|uniref:NAD(P)-dependent oxidoreductase n=1 Tax=Microbacterium yannicii TaxID=671622 RepID=UPI00030690A7|nr:NAD(P)-dependent oxidoreductase [Microbacterium yannicii]
MARIGFLGLGTMGAAMARRLIDGGHEVVVWNRSRPAVDALVADGAIAADEPRDALATGTSFSMLANDEVAEQILSPDTVATAAGGRHVNMASVSPEAADRLAALHAAADVAYVAAPVIGRPQVAAAGKLNILAAGDDEVVEEVSPYLELMGAQIWRFGTRPRTANVAKIAVNYNIIHALQALGESVNLVERHGIEGAEFVDLLTSTLFGGVVYSGYGDSIARRDYPPLFGMRLGFKDLGLAERAAREVDAALPTAPALRHMFEAALADPQLAESDWAAIAEIVRRG